MKVIYACDDNYFRYIYISIWTLLEHNAENANLEIVFIEQDVNKYNLKLLIKLGNSYKRDISIVKFSMPKEYLNLPAVGASKTTFAKLLFSTMFPDDIVIFLDPDTLVLGDIRSMYEIDIEGYLFAGVIENLPEYHRTAAGINGEES